MKSDKDRRVPVHLPKLARDRLKILAAWEERKMGELMVELIEDRISTTKTPLPTKLRKVPRTLKAP
jgi:hypothetical protein